MKYNDGTKLGYEPIGTQARLVYSSYLPASKHGYDEASPRTLIRSFEYSKGQSDMTRVRDPPRYIIEWKIPSPEYPEFNKIGGWDPIALRNFYT